MRQAGQGVLNSPSNRMERAGKRVFYTVFAIVFAALLAQIVFNNMHFSYNPAAVLALAAVWVCAAWGLWKLTEKFAPVLRRREKLCCGLFFALLAAVLALVYSQTACYPTIDYERVFIGAVNYTVNGFIEEPYLDYFYKYPHNLSLLVLFQFVFRAFHRLGFDNFFLAAALLNGVCYLATYLFVYLCLRRLFGVERALFGVLLLLCCLPLLAFVSLVYTDTVSMPFIPLALYCALLVRDEGHWRRWGAAALVLGGSAALGMKIKYSVVIVCIAIVLDMALRRTWKKALVTAAALLLCYVALNAAFRGFIYANILEESKARDAATPFLSWIMMGLNGDGAHNVEDNFIVWEQPTAALKRQAALLQIRARLQEMGPAGFLAHLNQKALRSFGAGHLDADLWVGLAPMRETAMAGLLYSKSPTFLYFNYAAQGYYVALLALIAAGAAFAAKRREDTVFVPLLAIFGLFLFLLIWEAAPRYLLNHYGALLIAAVFGAAKVFPFAGRILHKQAGGLPGLLPVGGDAGETP